jgi:hypothetical protein
MDYWDTLWEIFWVLSDDIVGEIEKLVNLGITNGKNFKMLPELFEELLASFKVFF